jgi:hypothetical protein
VIGVCFVCAQRAELEPDHKVCTACHDPARCRRAACISARFERSSPKARPGVLCKDALLELGGAATSKEIAASTGMTTARVTMALRHTLGVRFVPAIEDAEGHWLLLQGADSSSTAYSGSSAQNA